MTLSITQDRISEIDIVAFSEKLEACARTMPPGEQALLQRLISRATTVRADFTDGYDSYPLELVGRPGVQPDPVILSRALGLRLSSRQ